MSFAVACSVGLRTAAADAFLRMQDAARAEDVWLIPISGYVNPSFNIRCISINSFALIGSYMEDKSEMDRIVTSLI